MQSVSFRTWTRVAVSISNDGNHEHLQYNEFMEAKMTAYQAFRGKEWRLDLNYRKRLSFVT